MKKKKKGMSYKSSNHKKQTQVMDYGEKKANHSGSTKSGDI
jgi:hypothetical protein